MKLYRWLCEPISERWQWFDRGCIVFGVIGFLIGVHL